MDVGGEWPPCFASDLGGGSVRPPLALSQIRLFSWDGASSCWDGASSCSLRSSYSLGDMMCDEGADLSEGMWDASSGVSLCRACVPGPCP